MTGTGKGKWWGICKDLASAMKTGRQAIMHTSQDGGQIEASVWRWWILRWKSSPSNTEKQLYLIDLRNWVNERPQRAIDGRRRWDMYPPMIEKGHLKISAQPLFCCFVQLCLLGMAQGKGMSTTFYQDWRPVYQHLLDVLPLNFVHTFTMSRRWSLKNFSSSATTRFIFVILSGTFQQLFDSLLYSCPLQIHHNNFGGDHPDSSSWKTFIFSKYLIN